MKCIKCDQKVTVRNIIRDFENNVFCKKCYEKSHEISQEKSEDPSFTEAKNICFAKTFIYTYSQLYKHKISI